MELFQQQVENSLDTFFLIAFLHMTHFGAGPGHIFYISSKQ